jgi:predicted NAD/FAD-dependent oxidoreductase
MTDQVAIVGAGAAGAGAAYALREAEAAVTVFEKSRGVCGRAATRRKEGCTYDHGANYTKPDDARTTTLIEELLDTEGLVDIDEGIYTFDADGEISEGKNDDDHKWTYEEGLTQLGKRLFDRADAEIRFETRVEAIERDERDSQDGQGEATEGNANDGSDGHNWQPIDADGEELGSYDTVLFTPPAPQTADVLESSAFDDEELRSDLVSEIEGVSYRTQLTAVLHYPFAIDPPYYALINTDGEHDIAWLSREECKTGHVPAGECLLIAQMAPDWSLERYDEPAKEVTGAAAESVGELFEDERFADPDWSDLSHWRFALPENEADGGVLGRGEGRGLFFAGDWVVGEGRVHEALRNGLETGDRIAERLN